MNDLQQAAETERVALAKIHSNLGMYALKGTFLGGTFFVFTVLFVAITQVITDRYFLKGWEFVGFVAGGAIPVTSYGAFIFKRALDLSAKVEKVGSIAASIKA